MSIQYHRVVDAHLESHISHFIQRLFLEIRVYTPSPHQHVIMYLQIQTSMSTSQLRLPLLRHLNHKLAKLLASLHVLEQRINPLEIVQPATDRPRHNRLQVLLLHKPDHVGELLARAHRGAAHFDVLEHGGHLEGHGGRGGHAVD